MILSQEKLIKTNEKQEKESKEIYPIGHRKYEDVVKMTATYTNQKPILSNFKKQTQQMNINFMKVNQDFINVQAKIDLRDKLSKS